MNFSLFTYYLPLDRAGPFVCTILNPLYSRMLCAKFKIGQEFPVKKISKFCQCIFAISYYLPLEKRLALHFHKPEFLLPKNALCQV